MQRRNFLASSAVAVTATNAGTGFAQTSAVKSKAKNFVLVPGSWHGGWCWDRTATELKALGHRAFAVTQTGMGDRKHLAAAATNIDIYVEDIVQTIESEELTEVILVGHSFGGIPITGAGARLPDRIRKLVYLDAGVSAPGESAISPLAPDEQERRRQAAMPINGVAQLLPPSPLPAYWGLSEDDAKWVARRLTPHPFATYATPVHYDRTAWERVPRCYIESTAPRHPALGGLKARLREDPKWEWREIAAGHDSMVSHPKELARLLNEV